MTKAQEKALTVPTSKEVQQERFAQLVVYGPDDGDGRGLSIAAASRHMGIHRLTGEAWWQTKLVQDLVRSYLDASRKHLQLKATRLADAALDTLDKATRSPAYTPTQRAAAKDILVLAMGESAAEDVRVGLVVNVNATLPSGVMLAQQTRHAKFDNDNVVGGTATVVE
jgi:hypothetical protein